MEAEIAVRTKSGASRRSSNRTASDEEVGGGSQPAPCVPADPKKQANEAIRESLMTLLAYPRQAGTYVEPQLLGLARLELYRADEKVFYFYFVPDSGERLEQAICRLAVDKSRVEVAKEKQGVSCSQSLVLAHVSKAAF